MGARRTMMRTGLRRCAGRYRLAAPNTGLVGELRFALLAAFGCLCITGCKAVSDTPCRRREELRLAILTYLEARQEKVPDFIRDDFSEPASETAAIPNVGDFGFRGWHYDGRKKTFSKLYDFPHEAYWCVFTVENGDARPAVSDLRVTKDMKLLEENAR